MCVRLGLYEEFRAFGQEDLNADSTAEDKIGSAR